MAKKTIPQGVTRKEEPNHTGAYTRRREGVTPGGRKYRVTEYNDGNGAVNPKMKSRDVRVGSFQSTSNKMPGQKRKVTKIDQNYQEVKKGPTKPVGGKKK